MTKRCPLCGGFISDENFTGIHEPKPKCPGCSSAKIWKDGTRDRIYCKIQRYLCRVCGLRFSER